MVGGGEELAERQGFMIWREDGNMLVETNDHILAVIVRALVTFSTTGELQELSELSGMEKALYNSMISKIIRDDGKYYDKIKAQTINGFVSGIKARARSEGKRISDSVAKFQAEQMYNEKYNGGQPSSTIVNGGQLTKRSVAERNESPSLSITSSPAVAGAEALASADAITTEGDQWKNLLAIVKEKRTISPWDSKRLSEYFHDKGYYDTLKLVKDDEKLNEYLRG